MFSVYSDSSYFERKSDAQMIRSKEVILSSSIRLVLEYAMELLVESHKRTCVLCISIESELIMVSGRTNSHTTPIGVSVRAEHTGRANTR